MIILTETTDKIQAVLSTTVTANQMECMSSWRDVTTLTFIPGRTLVNTNNVTDVDLVGSPLTATQRIVDFLSIYNKDTVAQTVTVKFDANGTERILFKCVLASGEILTYCDGSGWTIKNGLNSIGYVINVQALTSSPTDSQTVYFGTMPKAPVTVVDTSKVFIPKSGRIKRAEIYCYSGTAGSAEAWSLYVRINNTTDYLIATLSVTQSERIFSNSTLDIPVSAGDRFEIKGVQPLWGTNPLTTIYGGYIYIE